MEKLNEKELMNITGGGIVDWFTDLYQDIVYTNTKPSQDFYNNWTN